MFRGAGTLLNVLVINASRHIGASGDHYVITVSIAAGKLRCNGFSIPGYERIASALELTDVDLDYAERAAAVTVTSPIYLRDARYRP